MDKPNKPLKDWTLAETRYFCEHHDCPECPLIWGKECALKTTPDIWDFPDRPKYTADEVALAKLLMKAGAAIVGRNSEWLVQLGNSGSDKAWWLPAKAFPSLEVGRIVGLKEIAESEAPDETD